MKIRSSSRWSADNPPYRPASPRVIEDAQSEQRRILKRLRGLIEMHQEFAVRMNVALEVADVLAVIDALVAEAERCDPLPVLKCPDDVREYARFTLYEEMLGEPSNVLLSTRVSAETMRYEAMPRAFWLDCLRALRKEWQTKASATAIEGITPLPES